MRTVEWDGRVGTVEWDGRVGRSGGTVEWEWDGRVGRSSGTVEWDLSGSGTVEWDYDLQRGTAQLHRPPRSLAASAGLGPVIGVIVLF